MKKIIKTMSLLVLLLALIITNRSFLIANQQTSVTSSTLMRSPSAVQACDTNNRVYVADYTNKSVEVINSNTDTHISSIPLDSEPNALAISADGNILYVAAGRENGKIVAIHTDTGAVTSQVEVGHTPSALLIEGTTLYVTNRFNGTLRWVTLDGQGEIQGSTITNPVYVTREPMAMVMVSGTLYVAGHLPRGSAQDTLISSEIVACNPSTGATLDIIKMANGSTNVKDIAASPDGQYLYVAHAVGRYSLPTTHVDRGWIYTNAVSEIKVSTNTLEATMMVDDMKLGAANPWGIYVSDSKIYLAISATRELMILNRQALRTKVEKVKNGQLAGNGYLESTGDISYDLAFLTEMKERIDLGQDGPRSIAYANGKIYVGNYYSGSVSVYNTYSESKSTITLETTATEDLARAGERLYHDATIGLQQWQSCASCHPDARMDALSWDNMNTGSGTPKQARTMIDSWQRGRVMSTGIRPDAATAVRAGVKHALFNGGFPEEGYNQLDAYIMGLEPEKSPYLENGALSAAAVRGKAIFEGSGGCVSCHAGDIKGQDILIYENYTQSELVPNGLLVPPLREVWRTAPYLHDGSAATIMDVLTTRNLTGTHGSTANLTADDLDDLVEYVLSIGPQ